MPRPTQNDKRQQTGRIPGQLERVQRQTPGVYETPETLDVSQQGQMRFGANAQSAFRTDESLAGLLLKQLRPITEVVTAIDRDRTRQDRELAEDLQMSADKIIANPKLDQKTKLGLINTQYSQAKPKTKRFQAVFSNQAAGAQAKVNQLNDEDTLLDWISSVEQGSFKLPDISNNPEIPSKEEYINERTEDFKRLNPRLSDSIDKWYRGRELKALEGQFTFMNRFVMSQTKAQLDTLALQNPGIFTSPDGGVVNTVRAAVFELAEENGISPQVLNQQESILMNMDTLINSKIYEVTEQQEFLQELGVAEAGQTSIEDGNLSVASVLTRSSLSPDVQFKAMSEGRKKDPRADEAARLYAIHSSIENIDLMIPGLSATPDDIYKIITKFHPSSYSPFVRNYVKKLKANPDYLDTTKLTEEAFAVNAALREAKQLTHNSFRSSLSEKENKLLTAKIGQNVEAMIPDSSKREPNLGPGPLTRNAIVAVTTDTPSDYDLRIVESIKLLSKDDEEYRELYDQARWDIPVEYADEKHLEARKKLAENLGALAGSPTEIDQSTETSAKTLRQLSNGGFSPTTEEDGFDFLQSLSLVSQRLQGTGDGKYSFAVFDNGVSQTVQTLKQTPQYKNDVRLQGIIEEYENSSEDINKTGNFLTTFDSYLSGYGDPSLLKNPEAATHALQVKNIRDGLMKELTNAVVRQSKGLYVQGEGGRIQLTPNNEIAVPFLLSDIANQQNRNGVVSQVSLDTLGKRFDQITTSLAGTEIQGRDDWYKANNRVMGQLLNLGSSREGKSTSLLQDIASKNPTFKKQMFGLMGAAFGLTRVPELTDATVTGSPKAFVLGSLLQQQFPFLMTREILSDEARTARLSEFMNKSLTSVFSLNAEPASLSLDLEENALDKSILPVSTQYRSVFTSTGRILSTMAQKDWVDNIDTPDKASVEENPMLLFGAKEMGGFLTDPASAGTSESALDTINTEYKRTLMQDKSLLDQAFYLETLRNGFASGLQTASDGGIAMGDQLTANIGKSLLENKRSVYMSVIPSGERGDSNALTRSMIGDVKDTPYEAFTMVLPGDGTALTPVPFTEKSLQETNSRLDRMGVSLTKTAKQTTAMTTQIPCFANTPDYMFKQLDTILPEGFSDESKARARVMLQSVLWERGVGTGPATSIKESEGTGGDTKGEMKVGCSWHGAFAAATVLSALSNTENEEQFTNTLKYLEDNLERSEGDISGNSLVSFTTYENGEWTFYMKNKDAPGGAAAVEGPQQIIDGLTEMNSKLPEPYKYIDLFSEDYNGLYNDETEALTAFTYERMYYDPKLFDENGNSLFPKLTQGN
mgnify:FL=1